MMIKLQQQEVIMKWIIKLMLVMALAFSGSAFAEKTPLEVAAEARVSTSPVDTTDMTMFAITQRDIMINFLNQMCSACLQLPAPKALATHLGFNPDLAASNGSILNVIIESFSITLGFAFGTGILGIFCFYLLYTSANHDEKQKAKNHKLVIITLVVGLLMNPVVMMTVLAVIWLLGTASANWLSLFLTTSIANTAPESVELDTTTNKLTQYDVSERVGFWNALTETITKSAVIATHNVQLGRSGLFASDLTKGAVLNDIQNNVKLNIVPVFKQGIVTQLDFVWNEKYDNYDAAKYGRASKSFSVRANNLDSGMEQEADSDISMAVRLKAQADGQKLFAADDFFNTLVSYESDALPLVIAGKSQEAQQKYDDALILKVADAMDTGLNAIKDQYMSEGLGAGMAGLYQLYSSTFINSAQGLNPQMTYSGKWKYDQQASQYVHKYNCSNFYDKQIDDIHVAGFNVLAAGSAWGDVNRVAASLPTQCVVFMNGKAVYMGVDAKTDDAAVNVFKDRTTAASIAKSNLTSNIIEGALTGQMKFMQKNNPYKNLMLANIDLGFIHAGLSFAAIGKAMNFTSRMGDGVRNGLVVDKAVAGQFSIGADFNMLFGDERETKDVTNNEGYKAISTDYKPLIFDALIDPITAGSVTSYQQAQTFNDSEETVGDMIINAIQSQSTLLQDKKREMGLSLDKTMSKGIIECNANALACDARATGTISDIYSSAPLMLGIKLKMGTAAVEAIKEFDISDVINKFGLSGDSFVGKALGKIGAMVGKFAFLIKMGVAALNVILVPIDLLANALIIIGVWVLALQVLPAIQMIMLCVHICMMFLKAIINIYAAMFEAVFKVEPRHFGVGLKSMAADWTGVYFYLMGFYFMIFILYYINISRFERALYSSVAAEGGLFEMMAGLVVVLGVSAMLVTACMALPKFAMGFKSSLFPEDSSMLDDITANRALETMAVSYLAEQTIRRAADAAKDAVKREAEKANHALKGNQASPAPAGEGKPASDTEGR
ncbi:hypothetical protein ALQ65_01002 [Pseudomonas syringae pv. coriandricola]|uniref:Uncharacterized protein n=2 Tax=Pseudomonas syringae group genomosp. 3 TaxID=251701 RepID=A0A3M3JLI0_9PSED|nr:hypothetical protein ALQ65_01002 [Pseudomonas syringae pv. coriandricola]